MIPRYGTFIEVDVPDGYEYRLVGRYGNYNWEMVPVDTPQEYPPHYAINSTGESITPRDLADYTGDL